MSDSGSMNLDLGVNLGVTLDGAGLQELSNTIKEISKGKDLQRYWKDVESATDSAAKAIERYNKNVNSKGLAENLLKQINALKALTKKENLSELFPNMELNLDELVESAKKIVPQINSQFSVDSFSQAFKTFDLLKEKSIDLTEAFRKLADYADLVSRNSELSRENSQFRELIGDSDVEEVKSKLSEIKRLREQAEEIFISFLKVNNVERTDYWGDEKFSEYFNGIRDGSLTATEAISRFKTEYAYLLEESFKTNNDTFGLEQLQAFSNKLDSIFRQVEETSTKINDIISNGVITKSVENLSMDSSLSDSQRSLFGNLLQDEESLKSITALFQKLIEESNKTKNSELFNSEQLQQVLSIFDRIENSLSSLRSVISDVGDGEEFSPLLKMIDKVQSSVLELSTSVKGIGLNMNIDVGSDGELDRKFQSKVANALQAYQKLFNNIKMSSAGGSFINQDFFDFNLDNYDTAYQKLQAIVNFIKKQRVEAKKQFNGYDALYEDSDKSLWKSAQAYLAQVTKAETEIKKANSGETNPLENLFGNTKDLSEVIEQLNKVVEKLNDISSSATEFKNIFKEGFNVTASVEEIDKLTNRVKELEDELSKIKLNPVNVDKSNISSENSIVESQNKIQEELKETQKQAEETSKAILKVTAYRGTNGGDPVTSNKSGATFWDSKKNVANMYGTNSSDKTLWSSELSFNNPLVIDAKKQKYGDISYLGDGADKASKAILELTKRENQLRESLEKSTKSGLEEVAMAYELQDVCRQIKKISDDTSNPYGTHSSDWFAEYAKNNGYDGLHIKNVLDTPDSYAKNGTEVSDVFVTFQREQLENTVLLAKANKDLAESEREVALAELGVVKNTKPPIEDVIQGDKIDQVTTSAKELDNTLEQVNIPTDSFDEVLSKLDLTKSELGEIVKITKQSVSDSEGKFHDSYTLKDKRGSTEIYGLSSNTEKGQLLRSNIVGYDTKAEAQESKRLVEENIRLNKAYYDSKKQEEVEYQRLRAKYLAEGKAQEEKIVKDVWDKNVKAIQDYMDAVTKLNNLNAKDKGSGKYASQIALQEKNVEELKEKALEARTAITSMINPHDVPLNTWRDYLDVMKKFDQASLGSVESVAKLEDALRKMDFSSLESTGTKFESQFKNLSIKPDGDHQFLSWTNDLNELNAKIDEYNSKVKYLKENNIVDGEQVDEVKNLRDEIEETINVMTKTPQAKRGWTDIGASKAAEKVANVLKQNTKMSKEAREAIRAYYNELRSGNPSQPIDEILVKVNQLVQKERELGRVGKSFGEIFKEKVIYGGAAQLAGMFGFYDVINVIRQAGEAVIDLNTNITELAKVSEASVSQIYDDFNSYADIAKEVGGTISDTISATADWSRNGYNIPDSKELAEVAMIYKNVGDGIDIDQANEYLISTLRGFSLEAKDAMDIIDSINEVANNEPISSAGIGEALQRSAAAFNVANTSLQESIALVTSTNSVLQSPEKVGSMWTTVSARIRGAKTELEDAGLETDGMVESTSKLQAMIKGMTGFDILEDDQKTFKSIYDIIIGIGEEFQNLSGVDQAALLEALAGGIILPENMETYLMNIFNCKVNLKLYATI